MMSMSADDYTLLLVVNDMKHISTISSMSLLLVTSVMAPTFGQFFVYVGVTYVSAFNFFASRADQRIRLECLLCLKKYIYIC